MKNLMILSVLLLLVCNVLTACSNESSRSGMGEAEDETAQITDKEAVILLVEEFGQRLKKVSLVASEQIVKQSIEENYGDLISQSLLTKWLKEPDSVPGRRVSSPWPERIEVEKIEQSAEDEFKVSGEVVEITSVEQLNGGYAARYPISLIVKKIDSQWLIDNVIVEKAESIGMVYKNFEYGFAFKLPESWAGYEIVMDTWQGEKSEGSSGEMNAAASGRLFKIRHPAWTEDDPRQDIPIMIFSIDQWDTLQRGDFHIGAAPIGPRELGRNNKYVFALPARYNFAFPTGYEEVEKILEHDPLLPLF